MWGASSNGHAPRGGFGYKTITHRHERRDAQREIRAQLTDFYAGRAA